MINFKNGFEKVSVYTRMESKRLKRTRRHEGAMGGFIGGLGGAGAGAAAGSSLGGKWGALAGGVAGALGGKYLGRKASNFGHDRGVKRLTKVRKGMKPGRFGEKRKALESRLLRRG